MPIEKAPFRYTLPSFLQGIITPTFYSKWLRGRSTSLYERDKKRGKPYALNATRHTYELLIHNAVVNGGQFDPYTGEPLSWNLVGTWDTSHKQPDGYLL